MRAKSLDEENRASGGGGAGKRGHYIRTSKNSLKKLDKKLKEERMVEEADEKVSAG